MTKLNMIIEKDFFLNVKYVWYRSFAYLLATSTTLAIKIMPF